MSKFHIGEMTRRTGLTPAVLRAWETRYGLLRPARSAGGTRLYSADDLARVELMQAHMASGLPASEAAQSVLAQMQESGESSRPPGAAHSLEGQPVSELAGATQALRSAMMALERDRAEQVIDNLLGWVPVEILIGSVILPYLQDVGQRWADGETGIAEEHLATNILRARFLALTRSQAADGSAPVLLACPPEERHDLPLVLLMALLRANGASTVLLGADTPIETVAQAAAAIDPRAIVLSATQPHRFSDVLEALSAVAARWPTLIAGPGATAAIAREAGARRLESLVTGATEVLKAAPRG